jgi:hypothetical protein
MTFKGIEVGTGDIVEIIAQSVPLPSVQVAVIGVTSNGELNVMSTLLAPFKHSGLFPERDVSQIVPVRRAEEAIPMESRGKGFSKGQSVRTHLKKQGKTVHGQVIAAFDGIVVAKQSYGQLITGGASFFEAV